MDREEQKQITDLIEGITAHFAARGGDVMDVEADAIIRALFVRNPDAAYWMTKLALEQSQQIRQLQAQIAGLSSQSRAGLLTRLFRKAGARDAVSAMQDPNALPTESAIGSG